MTRGQTPTPDKTFAQENRFGIVTLFICLLFGWPRWINNNIDPANGCYVIYCMLMTSCYCLPLLHTSNDFDTSVKTNWPG